jgi:hypothetical protein
MSIRATIRIVAFTASSLSLLALTAVGCKSKEQEALDRIAHRKPPGYVRAVNLTNKSVSLEESGRILGTLNAESASRATTISAGSRTVDVVVDGKKTGVKFDIEPKKVYTVVVWAPDKASGLSEGLPRNPEDMKNTWVASISPSGEETSGGGQILGPGDRKVDVKIGQAMNLQAGDYASLDGKHKMRINPQYSYTVLFVNDGSKKDTYLLINSDDRRPAAAGQAGG